MRKRFTQGSIKQFEVGTCIPKTGDVRHFTWFLHKPCTLSHFRSKSRAFVIAEKFLTAQPLMFSSKTSLMSGKGITVHLKI